VLEAVLERLTYVNEETGYTVARVATGRGSDLLTVVGALLGAQPGEGPDQRFPGESGPWSRLLGRVMPASSVAGPFSTPRFRRAPRTLQPVAG
jgi:hypothetical protein